VALVAKTLTRFVAMYTTYMSVFLVVFDDYASAKGFMYILLMYG
jgi:hypothetical protein